MTVTSEFMSLLTVGLTMHSTCILFCMVLQGAKKSLSNSNWSDAKACWISAVVAGGLAFLAAAVGIPLLKRWVNQSFDK